MRKELAPASAGTLVMRVLFTAATAFTVVFIFANSSEIGQISGGRSLEVTAFLNRLLRSGGITYQLSEAVVRKLAHFAEYALLGFLAMLTLRVYTRRIFSFISWPLFFSLLVPVCDEFYQTFVPGRAGAVTDVLIDFAGGCTGIGFALVILLLVRLFR